MANTPLRAIFVGCGGMSGGWLKNLTSNPDIELTALVDINPENARRRAEEFSLTGVLLETDLERALAAAPADVVFDCTVPVAHHDVVMTALRHGCHVLGEKPLADTLERSREMVAAAKAAGRIYTVTQNYRYNANIRRLRAFLDSGALGRITTVYGDFFIGAHFGGFRDEMEHVLLLDMAIHTFDAARFLLGGASARNALCHEWNPSGSWYRHGASAEASFEMDNGAAFVYRGSWCAEGPMTNWNSSWRIVGEKGSVLWDGHDGFKAEIVTGTDGFMRPREAVEVPPGDFPAQNEGHASIIKEFVAAVRDGTPPETVCTDNIHSLAMVFGAIESAGRHARVDIVD